MQKRMILTGLLALMVFLAGCSLTGNVAKKSEASISIYPETVSLATSPSINIDINPDGYDCWAYVYNINSAGVASKADQFEYARGSGRKCTEPTTYRYSIPLRYSGQYVVRVYASQSLVGSNQYIQDTFFVTG